MICRETNNLGVEISVAGATYQVNDRYSWRLLSYAGHGRPNTRNLAQRNPEQDGDTHLGQRIDPRFLDHSYMIQGVDLASYYDLREEAQDVFRARANDPLTLTFYLPNGQARSIDGYVTGSMDLPPGDRNHTRQVFSVQIKCPDYRFYDPTGITEVFAAAVIGSGLSVPTPVPITISGARLSISKTITYANNSRLASKEYPVITINGPITDPIIENATTNEQIELTANGGLSLALGEFVVIDLAGLPRRDSKSITDQDGNSVDQFLSTNSDLATWHLSYNGELLSDGTYSDGNNEIVVTGTDVTTDTNVNLFYYNRYEGM